MFILLASPFFFKWSSDDSICSTTAIFHRIIYPCESRGFIKFYRYPCSRLKLVFLFASLHFFCLLNSVSIRFASFSPSPSRPFSFYLAPRISLARLFSLQTAPFRLYPFARSSLLVAIYRNKAHRFRRFLRFSLFPLFDGLKRVLGIGKSTAAAAAEPFFSPRCGRAAAMTAGSR